jgi:hypothetical protein
MQLRIKISRNPAQREKLGVMKTPASFGTCRFQRTYSHTLNVAAEVVFQAAGRDKDLTSFRAPIASLYHFVPMNIPRKVL